MFPRTEPFNFGNLSVDNGNTIYWEAVGNPKGTPALFLHGGPGYGNIKGWRRLFDPEKFFVIYMDQRGCGRSRPLAHEAGSLSTNTTQALIADIESLRTHLGIERWIVTGGSWGTTLALAYAQTYPDRVHAMVLSSLTVTSPEEVKWVTEDVGHLFPKEWDQYAAAVESFPGTRLIDRYYNAITDPDLATREAAAKAWCEWEDVHVSLAPQWQHMTEFDSSDFRLLFATLVIHYWKHSGFLTKPILSNMSVISHIPAVLIHGRYDVSLPVKTAWELHKRWPNSKLIVIPDEGHGGPKMSEEMCQAISSFAEC
jgi:proline iminopeptidase